jgi:L-threonylcarbamoyladenylate synthase
LGEQVCDVTGLQPGDSAQAQEAARQRLLAGGVVAFPTETVYGLGALATHRTAVEQVYRLKNRPLSKPLTLHGATVEDLLPFVEEETRFLKLAQAFWPGPLTLIGKRRLGTLLEETLFFAAETIALRVVDHPIAAALMRSLGAPLLAPSANLSGDLSSTTAEDVAATFPGILVLDGGPTRLGLESTILDLSQREARLLRLGVITSDTLEACLGQPIFPPAAPQKGRSLTLRLNAEEPYPEEAFLAFGSCPTSPSCVAMANLSPASDLEEAGRNLFPLLHQLASFAHSIAVAQIPSHGLGSAINERLRKFL